MKRSFIFLITALNVRFLTPKPFQLQNNDLTYKNIRDNQGNYEFEFRNVFGVPEDDAGRHEVGKIEMTSSGEEVLRVNGSYHYQPSCDHFIQVYYMADEKGFRVRMTQHFNRKYEEKDGRKILVGVWCSAVANPPIGNACLASLQGACAG